MTDDLIRTLTPLLGSWSFEALVEGKLMASGATQFAWLSSCRFMMQRVDAEIAKDVPRE